MPILHGWLSHTPKESTEFPILCCPLTCNEDSHSSILWQVLFFAFYFWNKKGKVIRIHLRGLAMAWLAKRPFIWPATTLLLMCLLATLGIGFTHSSGNKAVIASNLSKLPSRLLSSQDEPQKKSKIKVLSPYDIESLIENDPQ